MFFILYFLLMLLVLGIATALNYKFKWVKQYDLDGNPEIVAIIVLACLLWPVSVVVATIAGIAHLFIKYCLPED
jgi:hypothetical protein